MKDAASPTERLERTMQIYTLTPSLRLLAAVTGTALMASGARRRGFTDTGLGLSGAGLLFLAFAAPRSRPPDPPKDIVDIASEDSFPASDPPSSW